MKATLLLPVMFAALLGQVNAAKVPADYYPHAAGTRWEYSSGEAHVAGAPLKYQGIELTPINREHLQTGLVIVQDLMEYRKDGSVWLRGLMSGRQVTSWYDPPLNVYPAGPLRTGLKWKTESGNISRLSEVRGPTRLEIAAGKFNAILIYTKTVVAGTESEEYLYFVPTRGLMKKVMGDGTSFELTKFVAPK